MQLLEQWLSVATRGLCDAAAGRVRAEIGEHYASALESAGTADVDPLDVERSAMAALGEAKTANRQYRRVLLTEGEDALLRGLSPGGWGKLLAGIVMLLGTVLLVVMWWVRTSEFLYVIAAASIDGLLRTIPVGSIRAGSIVRIARWSVLTLGLAMTLVSYVGLDDGIVQIAGVVFIAAGVVHTEYRRSVLRRKVPVDQWPRRLMV